MVLSTSTGERRWPAPARRGGMHVLGKVAVPKPVNLPSQRLENQGLDPNVEIVPKGTLSWGSRSSSSALNAWGSSALSPPTTDASAGSSSPLTGRPSSGGSGTRPSTAGSEKSHEQVSIAWGPNSRPSSASGAFSTNQTSVVSTRPRSAETRTGSCQLSRFAEPVSENSVAWGGQKMTTNLGTASTKRDGFTLSSGDFPTLGSETNAELHARRGHSSHGRPLSSGGAAAQQERSGTPPTGPVDATAEKGDVNTWRREDSPQIGGGTPRVEKWQRDPQRSQPYPTVHMPPPHFDPWHGTPIQRSPDGVWFRGAPSGGPYRPAVPPGGYPIEPFGYYPSQLPYRLVSNSQAGPRPHASSNSFHPKTGDTYCSLMPDTYVPSHPVVSVRPTFYSGPVPYDGYYGPPRMSFCPNDRDAPSMGLANGPYVCSPNQNMHPESGNFKIRPSGYGPSPVVSHEQMESTHSRDSCQGPFKVLLKQHEITGGNDAEETREPSLKPMTQNNLEADCRKGEATDFLEPAVEGSRPELTNDQRKLSPVPVFGNLPNNTIKANAVDDGLLKKPETAANVARGPQQHPTIKKNPTLIDKIEGLNTKVRISEGRSEFVKDDHPTNFNLSVNVFCNENASSVPVIIQEGMDVSTGDKFLESTTGGIAMSKQVECHAALVTSLNSLEARERVPESQRRAHAMQGRADFRGRGRFNIEGEEWKKKPLAVNSSVNVVTTNSDASYDVNVQHHHTNQEALGKLEMNHPGKAGGGLYGTSSLDSSDYQAQRAKMREIATQRAKQLQKEEEERIREQKAKALAKLEELDRRTLAENSTQKSESSILQHEESHTNVPETHISIHDEVTGVACEDSDAPTESEISMSKPVDAMNNSPKVPVPDIQVSSLPMSQKSNVVESVADQISSQVHDNSVFKQKQIGHKKKQHNSHEKNLGDNTVATGGTIVHGNMIVNPNTSSIESGSGNNIISNDDIPQQHKKNNRSSKNKHKKDEASIVAASQSSALFGGNTVKVSDENIKLKTLEPVLLEVNSAQQQSEKEIVESKSSQATVSADQGLLRKAQHPKRMSRGTQAFRSSEKFHGAEGAVWAPVRTPPNKNEPSEVADHSNTVDGDSLGKNGCGIQNISKGKRADIERYVPKPVAKEILQQNSQNPPTPSVQATSGEVMRKADYGLEGSKGNRQMDNLAVEKTDFAVDYKDGNSKHNKQGRTHASWRQRGSAESSVALQSSCEEPVPVAVVMDHGVTSRGRRHLSKVQRVAGHNHFPGNKNLGAGVTHKSDSWARAVESSEVDGSSLRIENQGDGEHMASHWQPKSQALSPHSQLGRAGGGGQKMTVQVGKAPEKEFSLQTTHVQMQAEKNNHKIQPEDKNYVVPPVNKNEKKGTGTFKEHTQTPYRGPPSISELASKSVEHNDQQMVSSEQQRLGSHNSRFNKQQEASHEGVKSGSQGQEVSRQRLSTTGERRKHNSHYEYQPVGSYNNKPNDPFHHNPNVDVNPRDGARGMGFRYKERGQNNSRRGGHNGSNGGSASQVATYGNGE